MVLRIEEDRRTHRMRGVNIKHPQKQNKQKQTKIQTNKDWIHVLDPDACHIPRKTLYSTSLKVNNNKQQQEGFYTARMNI